MFMSRSFFCKQNLPQQKISRVKQLRFHMYEQQAVRNLAQYQLQHGTEPLQLSFVQEWLRPK